MLARRGEGMQAFRATATVNEDNELRISRIPFPPGAELEVIVLGRSPQDTEDAGTDTPRAERRRRRDDDQAKEGHWDARGLIQTQYRLAKRHPGEFVVLVGTKVVHHSADREKVLEAYRQAWTDFPSQRPVVVAPSGEPRQKPLFRGRSLTAKLGR